MTTSPIFIFSSSWRSGSTLVQRYVTASGEALVWGETGGALNSLADAMHGWEKTGADSSLRFDHTLGGGGEAVYRTFVAAPREEHAKLWIANLTPPHHDILQKSRLFLDGLYGDEARALGYARWGIKETRCNLTTAKRLLMLYPDARFVFLVRNPFAVMTSIKRRNWMERPANIHTLRYFAMHWLQRSREFRQAGFGFVMRYEDFVQTPTVRTDMLAYLGVEQAPPGDFVATSRVDWETRDTRVLTLRERLLLRAWLDHEMREWGY